jgi:acetyl esterase/lipase
MMAHPLVCPSVAKSWKGAPPMFLASGQECCADSAMVVAKQAALDGVQVNFEQYMGMCHIFITFFPRWGQSIMMYKHWTGFIKRCVENPEKIATKAVIVGLEDLKEREVDCTKITELTPEDAVGLLEADKKQRKLWEKKLTKEKPKL